MLGASPSGGSTTETEDFVQFLLLEKGNGGVELEYFK